MFHCSAVRSWVPNCSTAVRANSRNATSSISSSDVPMMRMSGASSESDEVRHARQELAARQVAGGPEEHDHVRIDALGGVARGGPRLRRVGDGLGLVRHGRLGHASIVAPSTVDSPSIDESKVMSRFADTV